MTEPLAALPEDVLAAIRAHAQSQFPKECCGVVIVRRGKAVYVPCANVAQTPDAHFVISIEDYVAAEDQGEVIRIGRPGTAVHQPAIPATAQAVSVRELRCARYPWFQI